MKRLFKRLIFLFLIYSNNFTPYFLKKRVLNIIKIDFKPQSELFDNEISVCKYKYGFQGAFCISVDFDNMKKDKEHIFSKGSIAILKLADQFKIPISWAICGITAISNIEIFNKIVNSKIDHDLGIHTYSHRDFSLITSKEDVRKEISYCLNKLEFKKRPVTFIFPYNSEGYFDVLKEMGFIAYRSQSRMIGHPIKIHELWKIPPVYYLDEKSYGGFNLIKLMLQFSIITGCVFHIWFHPWSIEEKESVESYIKDILYPLLSYIHENRDKIWICTMNELANYCEARDNCNITNYTIVKNEIRVSVQCKNRDLRFDRFPEITLRIPLPKNIKQAKVLIDDIEFARGPNLYFENKNGRIFLYLTLSFKRPQRNILILEKNP
jgi:peptidoglycan/xylan/chitin deacetylase (PgdA/CDA1 family)